MNIAYTRSPSVFLLGFVKSVLIKVACKTYVLYQRHQWLQMRQRTRAQLQYLTPEQLDDIGITREQADEEMKKSYGE